MPVFACFRSILGVAEVTDKVVSFVSILLNHETHVGEIGLTAVHSIHAGLGMGTAMYAFAQYHDSTKLLLMVLPLFALQRAENAMKNTIDDAVYIINWIVFIIIIQ